MIQVALLAGLMLAPPLWDALSSKDRSALRTLFAEALAAPDAGARAELAARAAQLTEGHDIATLRAVLAEGPLLFEEALEPRPGEHHERFDATIVGFEFRSGGASYRYALDIPPRFDWKKVHGLLLDPGHGSAKDSADSTRAQMLGMHRRHAQRAGMKDWLVARTEIIEQVGADGARGALPDDQVARVFGDFFSDLATRVALDPDRILVSGLSQTGYWAWYLARFRADRLAGIAPMSAISRPADAYLANFLDLPVYVLHGDLDPKCAVAEPRATCARLAVLGAPVIYQEIAGAGHDYSVWRHQVEALAWLAKHPREHYPSRVSKSLQTELDGWCYWIRVDEIEDRGDGTAGHPPTAGVDAELDGQSVRIYSEGVLKLTLCLSASMLDLDQPIEVFWNGERVHSGTVERDFARCFEIAAEKSDWKATFEAFVELSR